ncbi:MAG: hypothetical protein D6732_23725 [Methanobacteriota archaeon]|nr:MAG: hypothetical protein D6732_23725 [Euryarchaeota archaeon]
MAEQSSLVRLEKEYPIEIDWRGFELHPETPLGGLPLSKVFPPEKLNTFRDYLQEFATSFGITDMNFPTHMPNTRRVIAVAEYARDHGRLHAFRHEVMNAYWRAGKDIEDPEVIKEIAHRIQISPEEALKAMNSETYIERVWAMRKEAEAAGITGIPTFFIGSRRIYGCQKYEVLAEAVESALSTL